MLDAVLRRCRIVEDHPWFKNPTDTLIKNIMLSGPMKKFVVKNKAIFEKAIIAYANSLPDTTKENCLLKNSHLIIDAGEAFLEEHYNHSKEPLIRAMFKIAANQNEHNDYEYLGDWTMAYLKDRWASRPDDMKIPNAFPKTGGINESS